MTENELEPVAHTVDENGNIDITDLGALGRNIDKLSRGMTEEEQEAEEDLILAELMNMADRLM